MRKKAFCVAISLLLLFSATACDGNTKAASVPAFAGGELNGVITVAMSLPDSARLVLNRSPLVAAANQFMKDNPKVTVKFDITYIKSGETYDKYTAQMAVRLMGGNPPDIIDIGRLPYNKYSESGYLCDLKAFMDADPSFVKEHYYYNVFEAHMYNNGLYALPSYIYLSYVSIKKDYMALVDPDFESRDSISFTEMYDLYNICLERSGGSNIYMSLEGSPYTLFHSNMGYLADMESKTARFDEPWVLEYLNKCKDMPVWPSVVISEDSYDVYSGYGYEYPDKTKLFEYYAFSGISAIKNIIGNEYSDYSIPVVGSDYMGNNRSYVGDGVYGIPAQSENKEAAWAFLKFLLEYYDENCIYYTIPVNKHAAETHIAREVSVAVNELQNEGLLVKKDLPALTSHVLSYMERYIAQCVRVVSFDSDMYFQLIHPEIYAFMNGKKTAEEILTSLQSKVTLFLNE